MQPVARGETVEADASTVGKSGTTVLWSLGRHTVSRAGRPRPLSIPRPGLLTLPTAGQTVGQPASGAPFSLPFGNQSPWAGRPSPRRLPDRLQRPGAGRCPRGTTRAWAPLFSLGRKIACGSPSRSLTVVGTVQFSGRRLNALPRRYATAPGSIPCYSHQGLVSAALGRLCREKSRWRLSRRLRIQ